MKPRDVECTSCSARWRGTEVTGAGLYLPAYAGNLDIMTSAGLQVAEQVAAAKGGR